MPTLFRLLVVIALIVGAVYGGMFALATYVKPNVGEISVRVPPDRINRQ
jgi:predicted MFS family arabinose efflux permease